MNNNGFIYAYLLDGAEEAQQLGWGKSVSGDPNEELSGSISIIQHRMQGNGYYNESQLDHLAAEALLTK